MKYDTLKQSKSFIMQNGIFLLMALLIAAGLKYHYSQARSDDLIWILGPTAGLVEHISGIQFEKEAYTGFVNHTHQIIIAPACAGVNFLIIAFCMAMFSAVHHIEHKRRKFLWLAASVVSAYLLTIFVNAIRIILSIYFYDADIYGGWITPQRVHRLEGTLIYFFFLCLFYRIIKKSLNHYVSRTTGARKGGFPGAFTRLQYFRWACAGLIPMFWYGLITIVVPLLNAAYRQNGARFAEHSWMVICGCLMVVAAGFLFQMVWQGFSKPIKPIKNGRSLNHETKDSHR
jgi:exosortase K